MNIAKKIVDALKEKTKPSGYDTTATVKRIDGQTAWVSIAGGVDETPVKMSINVEPGDNVNVRLAGGKAWITGNNTAPPTDDKKANQVSNELRKFGKTVNQWTTKAGAEIEVAKEKAIEAQTSADGKNTIYYTQTMPTEGNTGDTWFNPNEGNAIYRFNGTTWVKEELGADAIANLSITNAKIAEATIQSGKIANLDAAKITSGTISALRLDVPGIITSGNIATQTDVADAVDDVADDAVYEEQIIYKSAASGTNSMAGTTTWVTNSTGNQGIWTVKRPVYSSGSPVLFTAKQKKTVSGTVTCTTPMKDDTLTIIDGGHITTGTIDASQVTVTNLDANSITSGKLDTDYIDAGSFTITGGSVNITTSSAENDKIALSYGSYTATIAPNKVQSKRNEGSYTRTSYISSEAVRSESKSTTGQTNATHITPNAVNVYGINASGATYCQTIIQEGIVNTTAKYQIGGVDIVDHVIAQGNPGDWYYRKWKSGKIEAWAALNIAVSGSGTQIGNSGIYQKEWSVTLPSAVFPSGSYPNGAVVTLGTNVSQVIGVNHQISNATISGHVYRVGAFTGSNLYLRFYVWKN